MNTKLAYLSLLLATLLLAPLGDLALHRAAAGEDHRSPALVEPETDGDVDAHRVDGKCFATSCVLPPRMLSCGIVAFDSCSARHFLNCEHIHLRGPPLG